MKQLTCRDLGGPCDAAFTADSFEEIGRKSHAHVIDMINSGDAAHQDAAERMKRSTPAEQRAMMAEFEKRFRQAPDM